MKCESEQHYESYCHKNYQVYRNEIEQFRCSTSQVHEVPYVQSNIFNDFPTLKMKALNVKSWFASLHCVKFNGYFNKQCQNYWPVKWCKFFGGRHPVY